MSADYNPSQVEAKWQQKWEEEKVYCTNLKNIPPTSKAGLRRAGKNKYYNLVMFPYPSGDRLHIGHWYNYAPADSHGRYMRLKGKDVFQPMGFDAFGLPAENHAIKTGVHPDASTRKNVETMIAQLKKIGCMYDWDKMVNTSLPEYYRWTQWLFLEMYAHGLAYKKEAPVNYCPKDQTVLANEQVWDGKCERCGTEVVQKFLTQWFWNIKKYSQRLLDGLETLDWPEKTKLMQKNWIGRSAGAEVEFEVAGRSEKIKVFTTRPDTLFGVTYMVLAPEHPLVDVISDATHKKEIEAYRKLVAKKTEMQRTDLNKDKTGVPIGAFAINPVNGAKIPVWIADYALMSYGTGAVMAVPGHDERDHEFAKKFKLPIVQVVSGDGDVNKAVMANDGKAINSDFLNGLATQEAKKKMIAWLEDKGRGRQIINYRLRDWLVSRQRYWGAPIPIVYDPRGKAHPVPQEHLPWILPTDVEFRPTGESPLKLSKEFKERTEKIFGKGWTPEYDTMDTFVCSSFYYLRYLASGQMSDVSGQKKKKSSKLTADHSPLTTFSGDLLVNPAIEKKWMPVDMYIGGPEHACMHLIYARFVMMALCDFGFVSHGEPFQRLVHQGLITNKGAKMSKSKGNVVSPDSFIERHGSDVFRMYLMFMGPFTDGGDWSDSGIKGIDRFVQRIWRIFSTLEINAQDDQSIAFEVHKTVKKVTESFDKMHFNTAISALMEFINTVESSTGVSRGTAKVFTRLLAPLAPHLAEELWEVLHKGEPRGLRGETGFVIDEEWPQFDPALLVSSTLKLVVQVNGKLRANIEVAADASEKEILETAKAHENVKKFLTGPVKKEIYVKGKLVSLVV